MPVERLSELVRVVRVGRTAEAERIGARIRVIKVGLRGRPGAPGPPGPGADGQIPYYVHEQLLASALWTVTHNLGRLPAAVNVTDLSGEVVGADVVLVDVNVLTVESVIPTTGRVYVS